MLQTKPTETLKSDEPKVKDYCEGDTSSLNITAQKAADETIKKKSKKHRHHVLVSDENCRSDVVVEKTKKHRRSEIQNDEFEEIDNGILNIKSNWPTEMPNDKTRRPRSRRSSRRDVSSEKIDGRLRIKHEAASPNLADKGEKDKKREKQTDKIDELKDGPTERHRSRRRSRDETGDKTKRSKGKRDTLSNRDKIFDLLENYEGDRMKSHESEKRKHKRHRRRKESNVEGNTFDTSGENVETSNKNRTKKRARHRERSTDGENDEYGRKITEERENRRRAKETRTGENATHRNIDDGKETEMKHSKRRSRSRKSGRVHKKESRENSDDKREDECYPKRERKTEDFKRDEPKSGRTRNKNDLTIHQTQISTGSLIKNENDFSIKEIYLMDDLTQYEHERLMRKLRKNQKKRGDDTSLLEMKVVSRESGFTTKRVPSITEIFKIPNMSDYELQYKAMRDKRKKHKMVYEPNHEVKDNTKIEKNKKKLTKFSMNTTSSSTIRDIDLVRRSLENKSSKWIIDKVKEGLNKLQRRQCTDMSAAGDEYITVNINEINTLNKDQAKRYIKHLETGDADNAQVTKHIPPILEKLKKSKLSITEIQDKENISEMDGYKIYTKLHESEKIKKYNKKLANNKEIQDQLHIQENSIQTIKKKPKVEDVIMGNITTDSMVRMNDLRHRNFNTRFDYVLLKKSKKNTSILGKNKMMKDKSLSQGTKVDKLEIETIHREVNYHADDDRKNEFLRGNRVDDECEVFTHLTKVWNPLTQNYVFNYKGKKFQQLPSSDKGSSECDATNGQSSFYSYLSNEINHQDEPMMNHPQEDNYSETSHFKCDLDESPENPNLGTYKTGSQSDLTLERNDQSSARMNDKRVSWCLKSTRSNYTANLFQENPEKDTNISFNAKAISTRKHLNEMGKSENILLNYLSHKNYNEEIDHCSYYRSNKDDENVNLIEKSKTILKRKDNQNLDDIRFIERCGLSKTTQRIQHINSKEMMNNICLCNICNSDKSDKSMECVKIHRKKSTTLKHLSNKIFHIDHDVKEDAFNSTKSCNLINTKVIIKDSIKSPNILEIQFTGKLNINFNNDKIELGESTIEHTELKKQYSINYCTNKKENTSDKTDENKDETAKNVQEDIVEKAQEDSKTDEPLSQVSIETTPLIKHSDYNDESLSKDPSAELLQNKQCEDGEIVEMSPVRNISMQCSDASTNSVLNLENKDRTNNDFCTQTSFSLKENKTREEKHTNECSIMEQYGTCESSSQTVVDDLVGEVNTTEDVNSQAPVHNILPTIETMLPKDAETETIDVDSIETLSTDQSTTQNDQILEEIINTLLSSQAIAQPSNADVGRFEVKTEEVSNFKNILVEDKSAQCIGDNKDLCKEYRESKPKPISGIINLSPSSREICVKNNSSEEAACKYFLLKGTLGTKIILETKKKNSLENPQKFKLSNSKKMFSLIRKKLHIFKNNLNSKCQSSKTWMDKKSQIDTQIRSNNSSGSKLKRFFVSKKKIKSSLLQCPTCAMFLCGHTEEHVLTMLSRLMENDDQNEDGKTKAQMQPLKQLLNRETPQDHLAALNLLRQNAVQNNQAVQQYLKNRLMNNSHLSENVCLNETSSQFSNIVNTSKNNSSGNLLKENNKENNYNLAQNKIAHNKLMHLVSDKKKKHFSGKFKFKQASKVMKNLFKKDKQGFNYEDELSRYVNIPSEQLLAPRPPEQESKHKIKKWIQMISQDKATKVQNIQDKLYRKLNKIMSSEVSMPLNQVFDIIQKPQFHKDQCSNSGRSKFDLVNTSNYLSDDGQFIMITDQLNVRGFLVSVGFKDDAAWEAQENLELNSRLQSAISEARSWVNKILMNQGLLIYILAVMMPKEISTYYLQIVEAIVNNRITNVGTLLSVMMVLKRFQRGKYGIKSIISKEQARDLVPRQISESEKKYQENRSRFLKLYEIGKRAANKVGKVIDKEAVGLLARLTVSYSPSLKPYMTLMVHYIAQNVITNKGQLSMAVSYLQSLNITNFDKNQFELNCGLARNKVVLTKTNKSYSTSKIDCELEETSQQKQRIHENWVRKKSKRRKFYKSVSNGLHSGEISSNEDKDEASSVLERKPSTMNLLKPQKQLNQQNHL